MKYEITVETTENGQRRRYGDTHRNYIVSSKELTIQQLKDFATKILNQSIPEKKYLEKIRSKESDFGDNFLHYYSKLEVLEKTDNSDFMETKGINKIEYHVVEPSTH